MDSFSRKKSRIVLSGDLTAEGVIKAVEKGKQSCKISNAVNYYETNTYLRHICNQHQQRGSLEDTQIKEICGIMSVLNRSMLL